MAPPLGTATQEGPCGAGRNMIMHPLYLPRSPAWLDLKLFYVRMSNCEVGRSLPEHLTVSHTPLTVDTVLEVNGRRSGITSELVSSVLRRNRADKASNEVVFVSTDCMKITGSVRFEVHDNGKLLLSGVLELSKIIGITGETKGGTRTWSMKFQPVMYAGSFFSKGLEKLCASPEMPLPTIEVYVAGSFSGSALILTKTLQLGVRTRSPARSALDSIPENDVFETEKEGLPEAGQQMTEYEGFAPENVDDDIDFNSFYSRSEFMEREDGELTWFNAGVRVGVGLGLGICIGVGLGVGLLVRTYRAASRNFSRRSIL